MELRVLRYFLAVVDTGSMTAAAARVHVAQPSISRQLRSLERELGAELLRRTASGVRLTAAGRRFVPVARDLTLRAARGTELLQAVSGHSPLQFRVACPNSTITHLMAPFVAELGGPFTDARGCEPDEVYERLRAGDVDIGISTGPPPGGMAVRRLGGRRISAQMPATHPMALEGNGDLELASLLEHPVIVSSRASAVRRALDTALYEQGAPLRPAFESQSEAMAQALAAAGHGVCVVADHPQFDLSVRPLTGQGRPLAISLYAGWDPDHYAHEEIDAAVQQLSSWLMANDGGRKPGSRPGGAPVPPPAPVDDRPVT
ncbi:MULTISPECIES: LysR family transcriptional regulator [Streptomyces]|uniref:LysR family transcriptional regulator n=1 Tax=Streptomyces glycanivorans TaxID=3033808 RepID=A0ABY9J7L5_9ACTN|nr:MULTISPECIES: LysR family transcriptional regulator [unclassified Streptomyces]WLQ63653.1 LysR family transcriptional regulator [Streptomyces sp. Alt3]WSQ84366.1 LysR family transcriptional regulator [Streptomyces sp. NBC_01212]WSR09576.1 LysR family transcriptional regulator [Streptomyces sp. NBC_01208]